MAQIPAQTLNELKAYINHRVVPCTFLQHVLANDFKSAIACSTEEEVLTVGLVGRWLYWEAPGLCWGSPERVQSWLTEKGVVKP